VKVKCGEFKSNAKLNSMEQSNSVEDNRFSTNQKKSLHFM